MHFSKTYRFKDFCDGALSFSLTSGNCPEFGKHLTTKKGQIFTKLKVVDPFFLSLFL